MTLSAQLMQKGNTEKYPKPHLQHRSALSGIFKHALTQAEVKLPCSVTGVHHMTSMPISVIVYKHPQIYV